MSLHPPVSPIVKAASLRARKSNNAFGFGDASPSVAAAPGASTLQTKSRSLAGEGTALSASTAFRGGDDVKKSPEECQKEALKSIWDCSKYAFGAGIAGMLALVFDNRQHVFGGVGGIMEHIPFMTIVEFSLSLHQVVFGYGLYQAYLIFSIGSKDGSRLDSASVAKLGNVLSWVWSLAACSISFEAGAIAYNLESSLFPSFWIRTVTGILFLVCLPICRGFHNEVSLRNHKRHPADPAYLVGRNSLFNAGLYMLFTASALAIAGGIDLVESTIKIVEAEGMTSKLGESFSGLMDLAESVTVTGLLATLYQRINKATVTATAPSSASSSSHDEYFEAQVKFYSRIGKFFFWQLVFTILPYVAVLVKIIMPHVGLGEFVHYLNFE